MYPVPEPGHFNESFVLFLLILLSVTVLQLAIFFLYKGGKWECLKVETDFAETKILSKELIMAARANDVVKSMNQSDSLKGSVEEQSHGVAHDHHINAGDDSGMINHDDGGEGFKQEMRGLEKMMSKLNPMAQEFVPPHLVAGRESAKEKKKGSSHRKKMANRKAKGKANHQTSRAQRDDIRRTIYISNIDNKITEEQLASLFTSCGQLVDCRICGNPNSVLRFGFVEFADEGSAKNALNLERMMLGSHTITVRPSKSAIAPVHPKFLPRSEEERERGLRTIYCTNIHRKVNADQIKLFFESLCGKVLCLRLLEDRYHRKRMAFVEFADSESAIAALDCSGVILAGLPVRVSPSKTPIRRGLFR